ncbi:MAG: T9SS type A sorting domain-containing protein [Cytophagaceae bacterium]|nr:T9SS type A sorting domain-containing protein [Cytophagaceae bacterium]
MKKVLFILAVFLCQLVSGQISGVINKYVKVTAVDPACNKATVLPTTDFAEGDTVLIIQMKGATAVQANGATFGDPVVLNDAGNYEFAEIYKIIGNDIFFKYTLQRTYNQTGLVQLVSVPQFTDVTIIGTLTAAAWDGNTGGVLVFQASGTITLNANIDVKGKGFRGGAVNPNGGDCFTSSTNTYFYASTSVQAGGKGEGIAIIPAGMESGRGKFINGGGGGNSHNTGGAGGGNFGMGGRGGDKIGPQCNNAIYPNAFGLGGYGLTTTYYSNVNNKIFLGGGGGAGQQNNFANGGPGAPNFWTGSTPGGPGGGIVIIKAAAIDASGDSILAAGTLNIINRAWGDGGGGGGAGGTVLLNIPVVSSTLVVDVRGSNGDRVYDESTRDPGPGGGGGGGLLWVSGGAINANITPLLNGGGPGSTYGPGTCACTRNAAAGTAGGTLPGLTIPQSTTVFSFPAACGPLPVEMISFSAAFIREKVKLEWTTASEKNNAFFIIEKTQDLNEFTTVAIVEGNKNSSAPISYFTYDYSPSEGTTYYRLSQKDIDGAVKVLGIREVKNTGNDKLIQRVYPVPFKDEIYLDLDDVSAKEEINIKIYNYLGELVVELSTHYSSSIQINTSNFSGGIYSIVVVAGDKIEAVKVLKN